MEKRKYENFNQLYKDYHDLIDAEFELRHKYRLNELLTSVKNRQGYASRQISGFKTTQENNYWREKIELYTEVYETIIKELELRLPSKEMSGIIDNNIKTFKNRVVDIIFSGDIDRFRGSREYYVMIKKAGLLADLFEYALKSAYYDTHSHQFEILNDSFAKMLLDNVRKRNDKLQTQHYHDEWKAFVKMWQNMNTEEKKEFVENFELNNILDYEGENIVSDTQEEVV